MGKLKNILGCGSLALMLAADGSAFYTINHALKDPSAMIQLQPFKTEVSRNTLAKASTVSVLLANIALLPLGLKRKESDLESPK